jgi:hypothetical protein
MKRFIGAVVIGLFCASFVGSPAQAVLRAVDDCTITQVKSVDVLFN